MTDFSHYGSFFVQKVQLKLQNKKISKKFRKFQKKDTISMIELGRIFANGF